MPFCRALYVYTNLHAADRVRDSAALQGHFTPQLMRCSRRNAAFLSLLSLLFLHSQSEHARLVSPPVRQAALECDVIKNVHLVKRAEVSRAS